MKTSECFAQIKHGMAIAFFASAYAEQAEDWGLPMRGEITDQLPDAIDPAANRATDRLVTGLIDAHNYSEPGLSQAQAIAMLYLKATRCDRSDSDRELTPELFGHYLAMQAMGTGVGLESFGTEVQDAIGVPNVEFSMCDLDADYFADEGGAPYRQYALGELATDDLEFDENAVVRKGSDAGAWVQAWVWVPDGSL